MPTTWSDRTEGTTEEARAQPCCGGATALTVTRPAHGHGVLRTKAETGTHSRAIATCVQAHNSPVLLVLQSWVDLLNAAQGRDFIGTQVTPCLISDLKSRDSTHEAVSVLTA